MYTIKVDFRGDWERALHIASQVRKHGWRTVANDRVARFSSDDDPVRVIEELEKILSQIFGQYHHPYLYEAITIEFQSGLIVSSQPDDNPVKKLEAKSGQAGVPPLTYAEIYTAGGLGKSSITVLFREPEYFEVAVREFQTRALVFASLVKVNSLANTASDSISLRHDYAGAERDLRRIRRDLQCTVYVLLEI